MSEQKKIAIIGLGYVGLPLAVEFGKTRSTIGFDINTSRVQNLIKGFDKPLAIYNKDNNIDMKAYKDTKENLDIENKANR